MILPKISYRSHKPLMCAMLMLSLYLCACAQTPNLLQKDSAADAAVLKIRFEHIAFNVQDPVAMAKWYTENLGMKIMRSGSSPTYTTFLADSGEHMMIEIFHNADYPLFEPSKIHNMAIHLAFNTPNIVKTQKQLIGAGASVADSLRKTASGDQVMTLRDPWGLAIQFVERVKPMLSFSGLYIEHFAVNVADSRAKAKWFGDNLGTVVVRDGKAPTYGMFISDAGKNMMFELYQQKDYPFVDFSAIDHMSFHVAFMTDNIQSTKNMLLASGAKMAEDIKTTPSGDTVLMLRDPWNMPIQFVKRANPLLK
jgi:glyoxylase I family protein